MEIELVDGMALVPAGAFWMGCDVTEDVQCREEESPYHEVTLDAYYIDRTEVTQGAYRNCIDAGQCSTPVNDWDPVRKSNRPVAWVSWDQAMAYCTWAGKRLPTEAEWEKAARGTDSWNYPWGNSMATCEYAVMHWDGDAGCGTGSTLDVCSKSPQGDSPYGLCDMSGNLDEWVSDYYRRDYYAESPPINPTGPVHGGGKVIRGGNYVDHYVVANLRASRRLQYSQQSSLDSIGFRCARDAL